MLEKDIYVYFFCFGFAFFFFLSFVEFSSSYVEFVVKKKIYRKKWIIGIYSLISKRKRKLYKRLYKKNLLYITIHRVKNIFTFFYLMKRNGKSKEVERTLKWSLENVRTIIKILRGCNNLFPSLGLALTLSNRPIVKFSHPSRISSPSPPSFSCFFVSLSRCCPTRKLLVT